jgi:hypothetical protein
MFSTPFQMAKCISQKGNPEGNIFITLSQIKLFPLHAGLVKGLP